MGIFEKSFRLVVAYNIVSPVVSNFPEVATDLSSLYVMLPSFRPHCPWGRLKSVWKTFDGSNSCLKIS